MRLGPAPGELTADRLPNYVGSESDAQSQNGSRCGQRGCNHAIRNGLYKHVLCVHTFTAFGDLILFYYTQSALQITLLHGLIKCCVG